MARVGVLIGGVALFVFGVLLFGQGSNLVSQVYACASGFICGLGAALNQLAGNNTLQQDLSTGQLYEGLGGFLALVGFVLFVYGAVAKGQAAVVVQQAPQMPVQSASTQIPSGVGPQTGFKFCPKCGARMSESAPFCPSCRTAQR